MDAEHRDGRLAVTLLATTRVASLVTAACRASHVAHSSGRIAPRPHCSQVDHDCATLPVTPPSLHLTRSPTLSPSMILLLASRTPGSCVSCRGASLDGGSSLLPPTGRARNLALGLRSFCAAVPMVEHIAEFCDLGVDALLLRLESSDRGCDDFIR